MPSSRNRYGAMSTGITAAAVATAGFAGLPRAGGRAGVRVVRHGRCGVCGWGRAGPGAAAGFYGSTMACGMKRLRQDCGVQRAGGSAVRGGRGDCSGRVRDCGVPRAGLRRAACRIAASSKPFAGVAAGTAAAAVGIAACSGRAFAVFARGGIAACRVRDYG
jgi:hypothetical protein